MRCCRHPAECINRPSRSSRRSRWPALAAALMVSIAIAPAAAEWQPLPPMPTARSETAAAAWQGRIYVPGGLGGTRALEAFDAFEERWIALPPLPDGRHHAAVAVKGGRLFVFGGADSDWRASATTYVYDIERERWSRGADMPAVRYAAAAVEQGPYIYIVGGDGPGGNLLRYEPALDRWITLAPNRQRREHLAAVAVDDRLLAIGGRWTGIGEIAGSEWYDPRTGRWQAGPSLNAARAGFAAINHQGRVYALGGEVTMRGDATLASVEVLDGDTWRFARDLPLPLHGLPVVSFGGYVYVFGGSQQAGAIANDGSSFRSNRY